MTSITLHGREVDSVFELLGSSENSITYSLGWALSRSPGLIDAVAKWLGASASDFDQIRLQEYGEDGGYTDIELLGPKHHVIIEAKRGWWLPGASQFARYAWRFEREGRLCRRFVAMSDCTEEYAKLHLPTHESDIELYYLGWRNLEGICRTAGSTHAEKRLLAELSTYLRSVATMQDLRSNMVFVVSLAGGNPDGASLSWIDIVAKQGQYFHPVGNRWPKEPPNYIAFRYWGRLQSIHHVDGYVVSTNLSHQVPGMSYQDWSPHFVYELGPAIHPPHEVKAGPKVQRSARVWVMLDLLLTSSTLTEALIKTKEREAAPVGGPA